MKITDLELFESFTPFGKENLPLFKQFQTELGVPSHWSDAMVWNKHLKVFYALVDEGKLTGEESTEEYWTERFNTDLRTAMMDFMKLKNR